MLVTLHRTGSTNTLCYFLTALYFNLYIVLKYLLLRCPDIAFDILDVLTSYGTLVHYVPEFHKETKLCMFLKNVDVASKSLELLNLLHYYCFWGLERFIVSYTCFTRSGSFWS
jgi:hypothetical protein